MKQAVSAHDVVRMKAQITPHKDDTFLHKQALHWTPNSSSGWQAQACLKMLQLIRYKSLDICLWNGRRTTLIHCNLNFNFWPGYEAFRPTVRPCEWQRSSKISDFLSPVSAVVCFCTCLWLNVVTKHHRKSWHYPLSARSLRLSSSEAGYSHEAKRTIVASRSFAAWK
jgi:hypothetical protein